MILARILVKSCCEKAATERTERKKRETSLKGNQRDSINNKIPEVKSLTQSQKREDTYTTMVSKAGTGPQAMKDRKEIREMRDQKQVR